MKSLRDWIDKQKPKLEKGGKYHLLKSGFGAIETFLFVPNHTTKKGTHIRDYVDLKRTMTVVIVALLPALFFGMYNTGYQHYMATGQSISFWPVFFFGFIKVIPIVIVSYVVGLGIEIAAAQIRGHQVNEGYLVTGMLIPLIMPVTTPLWMVAVSVAFSVIFAKEVFGGTGMNIWNPALVARAFLFFAYPSQMSGDSVWVGLGSKTAIDGFSGATPLSQAAAAALKPMAEVASDHGITYSLMDMFIGFIPGSIGETSKIAILIGAIILLLTRVGSWKLMFSTILGGLFMGFVLNLLAVNSYMSVPVWQHLIMGGFLFGAVFMVTDPVSGAQTSTGKWIYGFLVGLFGIMIRVINPAYPEGMMLSILIMNMFAPLIDYYVVQANIKRRLKRAIVKSK
ncbi:MAG: NADH:ubiquinone reductase (Na(+)-transporting) subunit B [Mariniphaga sp.]